MLRELHFIRSNMNFPACFYINKLQTSITLQIRHKIYGQSNYHLAVAAKQTKFHSTGAAEVIDVTCD